MTQAEIVAFNAGVAMMVALAEASAAAMRWRLVEKPTHFNFAIEGLEALAEASSDLTLPGPNTDSSPRSPEYDN